MEVTNSSTSGPNFSESTLEKQTDRENMKYIPELHDLGKDKQRLTYQVQNYGIPGQTVQYHKPYDNLDSNASTIYDEHGNPISRGSNENTKNKPLWSWSESGKLKLACDQPVVPVPIVQNVLRRDKIILIPQVEVTDVIAPKVYNQNIKHDVPKIDVEVKDTLVEIPNVKYVEKEVIIPIITGYTHKFVPKWEIHEVPRPVVKYIGEQKIVEVEVPEIKYVDKIIEREVVVDTVEKRVPKIIEIPKYVDEVQYVWKPIEKIVYVQKLVPKFDVNLECPPPLIVPYPVQTIKQIPPVMVKKDTRLPDPEEHEMESPEGAIRVPEEYVTYFSPKKQNASKPLCFPNLYCCDASSIKREDDETNNYFTNATNNLKNTRLTPINSSAVSMPSEMNQFSNDLETMKEISEHVVLDDVTA